MKRMQGGTQTKMLFVRLIARQSNKELCSHMTNNTQSNAEETEANAVYTECAFKLPGFFINPPVMSCHSIGLISHMLQSVVMQRRSQSILTCKHFKLVTVC